MAEAVAVPRPVGAKSGSGKTVFAGVMVFVLLVAFAAAFYFLGGADLVAGLIDSWFASAPPASSSQPPKNDSGAPAVVPSATPEATATTELQLPEGVDEAFAKRVYAEQIESRENLRRLATGEVKEFTFGKVKVEGDEAVIPVRATFTDKTKLSGEMVLAKKAGAWYLEWIARDSNVERENTSAHLAASLALEPDIGVLNTILEQQATNQEIIAAIVAGTYTQMTCDGVTPGPNTASIEVTLTGPKKASVTGRALCISKEIGGDTQWFLTSFSKS